MTNRPVFQVRHDQRETLALAERQVARRERAVAQLHFVLKLQSLDQPVAALFQRSVPLFQQRIEQMEIRKDCREALPVGIAVRVVDARVVQQDRAFFRRIEADENLGGRRLPLPLPPTMKSLRPTGTAGRQNRPRRSRCSAREVTVLPASSVRLRND